MRAFVPSKGLEVFFRIYSTRGYDNTVICPRYSTQNTLITISSPRNLLAVSEIGISVTTQANGNTSLYFGAIFETHSIFATLPKKIIIESLTPTISGSHIPG